MQVAFLEFDADIAEIEGSGVKIKPFSRLFEDFGAPGNWHRWSRESENCTQDSGPRASE